MIRESWLNEISPDAPCGPDLEYDQEFLALDRAAQGKPEQQYGDKVFPAEEPVWANVAELATALMDRTHDIRVVQYLARALTHTQGLSGTVEAMQVTHALLERFWDRCIPASSSTTKSIPMLRMNALAAMTDRQKLLRDIRSADFLRTPAIAFTVRDVENILDQNVGKSADGHGVRAAARRDRRRDRRRSRGVAGAGGHAARGRRHQVDDPEASRAVAPARFRAADLALEADRLHVEELRATTTATAPMPAAPRARPAAGGGSIAVGDLRSREDALRALDRVCDFLNRNEPTNPAPLLIRRAQRIMTMPFMDIIRELAPEATHRVETITGVQGDK